VWIRNLKLVLPDRVLAPGSIRIVDGRIAALEEGNAPRPSTEGV